VKRAEFPQRPGWEAFGEIREISRGCPVSAIRTAMPARKRADEGPPPIVAALAAGPIR
jgi:hypothetical protein